MLKKGKYYKKLILNSISNSESNVKVYSNEEAETKNLAQSTFKSKSVKYGTAIPKL